MTLKNRIEAVTSKDGTIINYHVLGEGPGLILLSGANSASQHYLRLAKHLADKYTVYVVDRRGRNDSGPQGEDYSLEKEFDDVIAILEKTKASFLFGHSSGAIITMNVACKYPLTKIALYEPPRLFSTSWMNKFEQLLEKKDYTGAQVTVLKGLKLGGKIGLLPDSVLKKMIESYFTGNKLEELIALLSTIPKEIPEVKKFESRYHKYAQIKAEALLMLGTKSPDHLKEANNTFDSVLSHSKSLIFSGLDHSGPIVAPEKVSQALKEFFR